MENEVRLNIKLSEDLLEAAKLVAKERQLTVSALARQLLVDCVKASIISENNTIDIESIETKNIKQSVNTDTDKTKYHEIAKRKRELKEQIAITRDQYYRARHPRSGCFVTAYGIDLARKAWKQSIKNYKIFCASCEQDRD